jgi:hypothetical protein
VSSLKRQLNVEMTNSVSEKQMDSWNVEEVVAYLQDEVFGHSSVDDEDAVEVQRICETFSSNRINGKAFMMLTESELKQSLQVKALGHRKLILMSIRSWKRQGRFVYFYSIDFDGMKSLLETLLLVNALVLTFAFSSFFAMDHDEIVQSDSRYLSMLLRPSFRNTYKLSAEQEVAFNAGDPIAMSWLGPKEYSLPSVHYFNAIISANSILFASLTAGTVCYTSLMLSRAKDRPHFLERWARIFMFPVFAAYCALGLGIYYLFKSFETFGNMTFPLYNVNNLTTTSMTADMRSSIAPPLDNSPSSTAGLLRTVTMNLDGGLAYFAMKAGYSMQLSYTATWIFLGYCAVFHLLLQCAGRYDDMGIFWKVLFSRGQAASDAESR